MTEADESIEGVVAALRRYLQVQPHAADTLEGIHRWWIDWGAEEKSPEVTHRALDRLVEEGVMEYVDIAQRRVWRARRGA